MASSARNRVLRSLPRAALSLIDKLEIYASTKIEFRDYSNGDESEISYRHMESMYADHTSACIAVPDLDRVNGDAIIHELLHLQRYWVGQIPLMDAISSNPANGAIASDIENCLEHLIIIPQQSEMGFDTSSHWNAITDEFWSDFPWEEIDTHSFRIRALTGWLTATACKDPILVESVEGKLDSVGLLNEARSFHSSLMCLRGSKPSMVSMALRVLKIPTAEVRLVTLDVRGRREIYSDVPAC